MTISKNNLLALVSVSAIAIFILWAFLTYRLSQLEKSSEQFSRALMENFFPSWDVNVFKNNASHNFMTTLPEDALFFYIENMKVAGEFREVLDINGNIESQSLFNLDQNITSFVEADVYFENDQAIVSIELVLEDNSWKFNGFYLDSSLLEE